MKPIGEASPRFKARIAGVFYLLEMLTGGFALFVLRRLGVSGDAAATATNILAHQSLFQLGFAANLLGFACYVAVTGLFYDLFKPVNRSLSLLAAFFSLVGDTVGAVSCLFELAPLAVLGGPSTGTYSRWNSCRRWRSHFSNCMVSASTSVLYFSDSIAS